MIISKDYGQHAKKSEGESFKSIQWAFKQMTEAFLGLQHSRAA
jgi:hypothetical protein